MNKPISRLFHAFASLKRLLLLDLRRALRDKSVIVIFGVVALLAFGYILLASLLSVTSGGVTVYMMTARDLIISSFTISSMPFLIIAVMVCIFIGKDLTYGTIRNKIIAGYSKRQIYLSNLIISLALTIAALLLYQLVIVAVGIPIIGFPKANLPDFFIHYGLGLLIIFVAISIIVFVEMMSKNAITGIIVGLLLFIFGTLISSVAYSYFYALSQQYSHTNAGLIIMEYVYFYQAYTISGGSLLETILGTMGTLEAGFIWKTLATNLGLLALLNGLGLGLFPKTDLK